MGWRLSFSDIHHKRPSAFISKNPSDPNCRKLQCLLHDEEETSIPSSLMMHGKNNSTSTSLLQSLYVYNCPSLISLSSKGQLPKALQQLEILDSPKLESIAERFHNNTSLGCIWIWKCENLKSLPEGLPNLNSLHKIYVWDCPSLVSFPEARGRASQLQFKCHNW